MNSVTTLRGWGLPYLGGDQPFLFRGVAPPWSPPIEGRPPKQMEVTDFKNLHKNVNFYIYSTSMFVKYLGLEIFVISMNRAVKKFAKLLP